MTDRAHLIARRIHDRFDAIAKAHPPLDPETCCWMHEDATESYCWEHAIDARAEEFGLGKPFIRPWYQRTDLEDAFFQGIGTHSGGESDNTEQCSVCGKTLSYILTDYGVNHELDYWLEEPARELGPETVYALDRLCLNVWWGMPRKRMLEIAVTINRAYRLSRKLGKTNDGS